MAQPISKKSTLITLKNKLKEELSIDNLKFWIQMFICILLTGIIVLSFFWNIFSYFYATLFVGVIIYYCFCQKEQGLMLGVLIYLLPFASVLKLPNINISLYSIFVGIFIGCFLMKVVFQLIKKSFRYSIKSMIFYAIVVGYLLILLMLGHHSIAFSSSIIFGLTILLIICNNKEQIDLKLTIFALFIGTLINCFLGLFNDFYPNLQNYFNYTHAYGIFRFSGLYSNTNAFSLNIVFCLALTFYLILSKHINLLFYPLFTIFMALSFSTLSKMNFIIICMIVPVAIVLKLILDKKQRNKWFVLGCVICLFISIMIQFNNFLIIAKRIFLPFTNTQTEQVVDEFTTGRTILWGKAVKQICDDPIEMLFGHDLGSDYDIDSNTLTIDEFVSSPHNTILQSVLHVGIVGLILIIAFCFAFINFKNLKNYFNPGLLILITLILTFCSLDNFSYIGGIYLSLTSICLISSSDQKEIINDGK